MTSSSGLVEFMSAGFRLPNVEVVFIQGRVYLRDENSNGRTLS